jgi:hypothetical protein
MRRFAQPWALLVAGLAFARPASALDKQACVDAATRGQIQRDDQKLTEALKAFVVCMSPSCPTTVRESCRDWANEVRASMPTVTVSPNSAEGVANAAVQIDGRDALFGTTYSVDPGQHAATLTAAGRAPVTDAFTLEPGERKTLELHFPPPPPTPQAPRTVATRPIPTPVFVLGGVAAVGGIGFAVFGLTAKAKTDRLTQECAPSCATSDKSAAFRSAVVADVSLLVAALAVASAGIFFFTRPTYQTRMARMAITPAGLEGSF